MEQADFWALIDRSWGEPRSMEGRDERLVRLLTELPAAEIVEFERLKDQVLRRADTVDLLAAQNLLMGGSGGGDGYFYFLHWLIGMGRSVYEAVTADADALVDLPLPPAVGDYHGWPEWPDWEGLISIADQAYSRVTGVEAGDYGCPRDLTGSLSDADTVGEPWDITSRAELSRRLPRLYAAAEPNLPAWF